MKKFTLTICFWNKSTRFSLLLNVNLANLCRTNTYFLKHFHLMRILFLHLLCDKLVLQNGSAVMKSFNTVYDISSQKFQCNFVLLMLPPCKHTNNNITGLRELLLNDSPACNVESNMNSVCAVAESRKEMQKYRSLFQFPKFALYIHYRNLALKKLHWLNHKHRKQ